MDLGDVAAFAVAVFAVLAPWFVLEWIDRPEPRGPLPASAPQTASLVS